MGNESRRGGPKTDFEKLLNDHGYGYVYAVLKAFESVRGQWRFEATEFPVEVKGKPTRVDFILRRHEQSIFLVAECKRARISEWFFVRTPPWTLNGSGTNDANSVVSEVLHMANERGEPFRMVNNAMRSQRTYQLGLIEKGTKEGKREGTNLDEIEKAITQVLRGVNGFADWCAANRGMLGPTRIAMFLPVIFTTAKLYVSSVPLEETDLATGMSSLSGHPATPISWLHCQYNQSPGLLNNLISASTPSSIIDAVYADYTRTVAVVSSEGIDDFLKWLTTMPVF